MVIVASGGSGGSEHERKLVPVVAAGARAISRAAARSDTLGTCRRRSFSQPSTFSFATRVLSALLSCDDKDDVGVVERGGPQPTCLEWLVSPFLRPSVRGGGRSSQRRLASCGGVSHPVLRFLFALV